MNPSNSLKLADAPDVATKSRQDSPRSSRRARRAPVGDLVALSHDGVGDAELVERAVRGDPWAEQAIFRRYAVAVHTFAERLLRRRSEADDVVQDTFAEALLNLRQLRDPAALRGWLFGIAHNRIRRRQRRHAFQRSLGLDRGLDDATLAVLASPSVCPERRADLGRIDAILRRIHADQRNAWMLRRVQGEQLEDLAAIVGCSLATAKRRVAAADLLIAAALERSP